MDNKIKCFKNHAYGAYICSKCKSLIFEYTIVGDEKDVDGYNWRGFCSVCSKDLQLNNPKIATEKKLLEIYKGYPCTPYKGINS